MHTQLIMDWFNYYNSFLFYHEYSVVIIFYYVFIDLSILIDNYFLINIHLNIIENINNYDNYHYIILMFRYILYTI